MQAPRVAEDKKRSRCGCSDDLRVKISYLPHKPDSNEDTGTKDETEETHSTEETESTTESDGTESTRSLTSTDCTSVLSCPLWSPRQDMAEGRRRDVRHAKASRILTKITHKIGELLESWHIRKRLDNCSAELVAMIITTTSGSRLFWHFGIRPHIWLQRIEYWRHFWGVCGVQSSN